jgi:hypothetical protein
LPGINSFANFPGKWATKKNVFIKLEPDEHGFPEKPEQDEDDEADEDRPLVDGGLAEVVQLFPHHPLDAFVRCFLVTCHQYDFKLTVHPEYPGWYLQSFLLSFLRYEHLSYKI